MRNMRVRSAGRSLESGFFFVGVSYLLAALVLYLCFGVIDAVGTPVFSEAEQEEFASE